MSKGIASKLSTIMGMKELQSITQTGQKSGTSSSGTDFTYDVFEEHDIVAPCQKAMAQLGLALIPSVISISRSQIPINEKKINTVVDVIMAYSLHDTETGECESGGSAGSADDRGDGTAVSKAITDANKTFLRKLFQISSPKPRQQQNRPTAKPAQTATSPAPAATSGSIENLHRGFFKGWEMQEKEGRKWWNARVAERPGIETVFSVTDPKVMTAIEQANASKNLFLTFQVLTGANGKEFKFPQICKLIEAHATR